MLPSSSDEPTGLFLGAVASPQSRPPLHPVRSNYKSPNPAQVFFRSNTTFLLLPVVSDEVLYKRMEPRGCTTDPNSTLTPTGEHPRNKEKPFSISNCEVWEGYQRVKANKGAAGIDEQSITEFEKDLKDNLYKLWNRMSSGSYFPPPVRTVKIPKASGGERMLGIPTVA